MKVLLCIVISVLLCQYASAHMYLANVVIDGKQEKCVRPHPTTQYDYPLSDKNSKVFETTENMICGWPPAMTTAAPSVCTIAAGSMISLQWWHANPGDDVVDGSHRGPCFVYMAKASGNVAQDGKGQVWFKIYEEGLNTATNEFCTDRIRKEGPKKGQMEVRIPSDIAPGRYLLRGETIALHEGYDPYGAQFYVGCVEITVTGGGSADPPVKVSIPSGLYKKDDPGILYSVYWPNPLTSYPIPGPALYVSGGGSAPQPTKAPTTAPVPATASPAPTANPTFPAGVPSPAPTAAPTEPPSTSLPCSLGSLGCRCSSNLCNTGLSCRDDVCVFVECNVGSEGCPCTQGGGCDGTLKCLSKRCVDISNLKPDALIGSSAKVFVEFSVLALVSFVMIAFLI